jgi:hypothetical protein
MTLGGTISSVMIRIKGDSSDAVKALDNVQDEAKKTEKALDEAAGGGDKMGMAMGAAAGAAAALAVAAAGVTAAVQAYTATNQDAADTLAGLSSNMNDMAVAVGEAIFESDGFQEMLGRVAQVMAFVSENAGTIAAVVSGSLTVAINTGIVVVDSFYGAVAGVKTILILSEAALDSMATATVNLGSRVRIVANAVLDFGLAIAKGVTGTMADAIGMAQSFVEGLAPVARFAGIDLEAISTGLGDMRDGLEANVTALETMQAGLQDSSEYQRELMELNNEALAMRHAERTEEVVGIYHDLDETLQATGASQAAFNFELTETGRRQREVATATGAATEAMQVQGTFMTTLQASIQAARDQAQITIDKEIERRYASALAIKQESEALYALHQQLVAMGPDLQASVATMGESLNEMVAELSPANQAMGVFREGASELVKGTMSNFVTAALSGENVGKVFKQMMGDMLMAQGSASIMQGALAMIPFMPSFNPVGGGAYLAQGALMFAAGKLMAGGKGGGGGKGKGQGLATSGAGQAPTTTPATQTNNSNVTVNNSFGIVGDQRQSARLVVDSLRFAQVEGL